MKLPQSDLLKAALFLTLLCFGSTACQAAPSRAELIRHLALQPGEAAADIGAGDGEWSEELLQAVGEEGQVYATEVEDEKIAELKEKFASLPVEVLKGSQEGTALPANCCDAILLRLVYHHFENPQVINQDIVRSLKPGGRLVLVDFPPTERFSRSNVPGFREGHGVRQEVIIRELSEAGLELRERIDDWDPSQDRFLLVFEKPEE